MESTSALATLFCGLALLTVGSSCLRTRGQIKDEGDDREIPAQVEDVKPNGQYVIDEIKGEMTRLTGRIEDLERSKNSDQSAGKEDVKKLDARIAELEKNQASLLETLKKLQDQASAVDPLDIYEKGKSQYDAGNFEGAADVFAQYLKSPKAAKKVEDAAFYRAESLYKLGQFQNAIVEYSKFPNKFTRSSRMPTALLMIGLSFEKLGMKDDAKAFFVELIDKYPKSAEAKKARPKVKAAG